MTPEALFDGLGFFNAEFWSLASSKCSLKVITNIMTVKKKTKIRIYEGYFTFRRSEAGHRDAAKPREWRNDAITSLTWSSWIKFMRTKAKELRVELSLSYLGNDPLIARGCHRYNKEFEEKKMKERGRNKNGRE